MAQAKIEIKDAEHEWVRQQIDQTYFAENPVSKIIDVSIQLQHTETDNAKLHAVKAEMLDLMFQEMGRGFQTKNPFTKKSVHLRIPFYTAKPIAELPRYWITRERHEVYLTSQYVQIIVDKCNAQFKQWYGNGTKTKENWESVSNASIVFFLCEQRMFKPLKIVVK